MIICICYVVFLMSGCEQENVLTMFSDHSVSKKFVFSDDFNRSNGVPGNDWTVTVENNSYDGHGGTSVNVLQISDSMLYGRASNFSNDSYLASLKMRASRAKELYNSAVLPCDMEFSFMYNRGDGAMYTSNLYVRLVIGSNLANEGATGRGS